MNYLEWVKEDLTRSSFYRDELKRIEKSEKELCEYQQELVKIRAGAIPQYEMNGFPFIYGIAWLARWLSMFFADESDEKRVNRARGIIAGDPQQTLEFAIAWHNKRISSTEYYVRSGREFISNYTGPDKWLDMKGVDEKLTELSDRLSDMVIPIDVKISINLEMDDETTSDLIEVLRSIHEVYGVDVLFKTIKSVWVCTLSIQSISITRCDTMPGNCILRTLLTFIDLAWEHFMPKEIEA